jgi:protease IV
VAAARAKLNVGHRVVYVEAPPGRLDVWLERFGISQAVAPLLGLVDELRAGLGLQAAVQSMAATLPLGPAAAGLVQDLAWFTEATDPARPSHGPQRALVHCLCQTP